MKQEKSSRKDNHKNLGHFKEIQSTAKDWMKIKKLNEELEPFNHLTKIMEGDGLTSAVSIRKRSHTSPNVCQNLEAYQEEALECEKLVIATLLHPTFQLKLFTHCWPEKANNAKALLEQKYQKRNNILKQKENDDKLLEKKKPTNINPDNIFDLFEASETNDKAKEL
ncbi:hypothetical protein VP01_5771g1 [Puccinia sorghi]|uniref:Uncharacterized protein n=1 Tax=Puccinia sorghi TaxID=27349 RepID=A0A0L6UIA5_9BASI|nr:hypothetical protein VP01_5771g1 [Puccinia sorghi]